MHNKIHITRRQFIQSLAAGGAVGACGFYTPLLLANEPNSWQPYDASIVIDGLSGIFDHRAKTLKPETLEVIKRSGTTAINETVPYPGDDYQATMKKIKHALMIIKKYPEYLRLIKSASDIGRAKAEKQLGIIIGFQSTEMFTDKLERIDEFAALGTRIMQLTYNDASQFGDGGLVKENRGLTPLGQAAIDRMEQNKVLLDLSHAGQKTVAQAIEKSTRPLTISHTGCNAIYQHPRNNNDAELRRIADKGGVVGIYLMPFLEGGSGEITAESFLKHLDYAINLCGEAHVAIGSDQGVVPVADGPEYREMIRQEVKRRIAAGISAPGETPDRPPFIPQLNQVRRMEQIAFHMKKRGYKDSTIEKVLGLNWVNLFAEVWG